MSVNDKLLKAVRSRSQKQEPFGFGVLTADRWVLNMQDQIGLAGCYKYASKNMTSFGDILAKAFNTLVYSNRDMLSDNVKVQSQSLEGLTLPKNTLMVFKHILTSSNKDRDGDILSPEGMDVDLNMLLLWQHVHTLPIGKSIQIVRQDTKCIEMITAIVDMNELCHDAAVMVDNGMGRFSHGFRALEFSEIKSDSGNVTGFEITKAEIMEESLVSVPANVDAETQEVLLSLVEGGKLTSPIMKEYGKTLREKAAFVIPGIMLTEKLGEYTRTIACNSVDNLKDALLVSGKLGNKNEDEQAGREGKEEESGEKITAPDETKELLESVDEESTEPSEVKMALTGSFEGITDELGKKSRLYLLKFGIDVKMGDWVYVIATYQDYAVVCVERYEYGVGDEFRHFKINWEIEDEKPVFTGEPIEVEIVVTAENKEELAKLSRKTKEEEKFTYKEAAALILAESTYNQKQELVAQLKACIPSKTIEDYKRLMKVQ